MMRIILSCRLQHPVLIGSAKVSKIFNLTSFRRKKFNLFSRVTCDGFRLKRDAKVKNFFLFQNFKQKNFLSFASIPIICSTSVKLNIIDNMLTDNNL